ncbi:MAG: hypothetical protein ACOVNN_10900 [Limnohabitans sp.]|jgi:hypothetical protein
MTDTLSGPRDSRALAQRLLHGCGWFALCVGAAVAALACWLLDGPLMSQPQWAHQVLGYFLWGRLPTFLVALFVMFRLNLHGVLHPELGQAVLVHHISPWGLGVACIITAGMCWMWLLLVATGLTALATEVLLGGHAKSLLSHLLTDSSAKPLWHGGLRLLVQSMAVAWVSFIELRFLGAQDIAPSLAFMRAMLLGGLAVVGIELADFFLFFA